MERKNIGRENQPSPAFGLYLPTMRQLPLPDPLEIPGFVRVLEFGVVLDQWFIAFPLNKQQMRTIFAMAEHWGRLDNSRTNCERILAIFETIESALARFCKK